MTNRISARIVADSRCPVGHRITTMEVIFPRFILAEFNTHRLFTRNSASSRAIPFKKMLRSVREQLFTPIAWQKDHSGMQGTEYFEGRRVKLNNFIWKVASKLAIGAAWTLNKVGVTKQLANRILEPFMYHKVLVTATEFENFFNLRCPQYTKAGETYKSRKDMIRNHVYTILPPYEDTVAWLKFNKGMGEIHIMDLAEKMWDALNESTPTDLKAGEWHIPYGDDFDEEKIYELAYKQKPEALNDELIQIENEIRAKIATARCARLSYQTLGDNPVIDYNKDLDLFKTLFSSQHLSPFEHVAKAMDFKEAQSFIKGQYGEDLEYDWCNNFRGFVQYRYILEKELKKS